MKNKMSLKSILMNMSFLIILIIITFSYIFRKTKISEILSIIKTINPIFLIIAISCMFFYLFLESCNIRHILNLFNYKIKPKTCLKYSFIGYFFSSITPSATGGQPMQVYYMKRDKIAISHSTLTLIIIITAYQFLSIFIALILFFINYNLFFDLSNGFTIVLIIGFCLNFMVLVGTMLALFSKKLIKKICNIIIFVCKKLKIKKTDKIKESMETGLDNYHKGATYITNNKKAMFAVLLRTLLQTLSLNSIPYFIYKSFGFYNYSFLSILSMQFVLQVGISSIPLPGNVGIGESAFLRIFKILYPSTLIHSAVLLSRGSSYYLYLIISGMTVVIIQIKYILSLKHNRKNSI